MSVSIFVSLPLPLSRVLDVDSGSDAGTDVVVVVVAILELNSMELKLVAGTSGRIGRQISWNLFDPRDTSVVSRA